MLLLKTGPIITLIFSSSNNCFETFSADLGSPLESLGSISIFASSIEFKAKRIEFTIDKPISSNSPDKGTTKPILTLSSEKAWLLKIITKIKILNNFIKAFIYI